VATVTASGVVFGVAAGNALITVKTVDGNKTETCAVTVTAAAPPVTPDLPGSISISPSVSVTTGTELTATYGGNVAVTYQWKKDGVNVGTGSKYTPAVAGSYTVTVSAAGYNSKTSAAVTVTAPQGQQLSVTIQYQGTPQIGTILTAVYVTNLTSEVFYQWLRNGSNKDRYGRLLPSTPTYTVTAQDSGCAISVEVNVSGKTATSESVYFIEWNNVSAGSDEKIALIKQEIQEAYDNNLNNCKTVIENIGRPWRINLTDNIINAKVIGGMLHIYFSLQWYDECSTDKATRLDQIGTKLKNITLNAAFFS
jgi:hypothetical protein